MINFILSDKETVVLGWTFLLTSSINISSFINFGQRSSEVAPALASHGEARRFEYY